MVYMVLARQKTEMFGNNNPYSTVAVFETRDIAEKQILLWERSLSNIKKLLEYQNHIREKLVQETSDQYRIVFDDIKNADYKNLIELAQQLSRDIENKVQEATSWSNYLDWERIFVMEQRPFDLEFRVVFVPMYSTVDSNHPLRTISTN